MADSRDTIRKEVEGLLEEGSSYLKFSENKKLVPVGPLKYQTWYTKAHAVVRQLIPARLMEFEELYKIEKRKTIDCTTYAISDYLLGLTITRGRDEIPVVNPETAFATKFQQQLSILTSARICLDSILSDISGVLRADIFDNEIDAARSLLKAQHLRAAGTVAGVVLESHLSSVCKNHNIPITSKNPDLSYYNDSLKNGGVIDVPTWRGLQRLGDIRNLCCHKKNREPTPDEVEDLILGVEKAINTLF